MDTKPFKVGKTYRRQDGASVVCIAVQNRPGYETAQFSDFAESHARVMAQYEDDADTMRFIKRDPDWNDPTKSGFRYNRAGPDRGRCTGTAHDWSDPFNVFPRRAFYVGTSKGATSWEWQVGRLFGHVCFPTYWFLRGRMMDGSRRSSFFRIVWERDDHADGHLTLWRL